MPSMYFPHALKAFETGGSPRAEESDVVFDSLVVVGYADSVSRTTVGFVLCSGVGVLLALSTKVSSS